MYTLHYNLFGYQDSLSLVHNGRCGKLDMTEMQTGAIVGKSTNKFAADIQREYFRTLMQRTSEYGDSHL